MSTIDSTVDTTVTLGNGIYDSSLTIDSRGKVLLPAYSGGVGINNDSDVLDASLNNAGQVYGGSGIGGSGSVGGVGGIGVDLTGAATVINSGGIGGGNGTGYSSTYTTLTGGGAGGIGVDLGDANASLSNSGEIQGGIGGVGKSQGGGAGGDAVVFGGSTLTNSSYVYGGGGGNVSGNSGTGGAGGMGLDVTSAATVTNSHTIAGGHGGYSSTYAGTTEGGAGGVAVNIIAPGATFSNTSIIRGGGGGDGGSSGGGDGAAGVIFGGSTMTNSGSIRGGVGGDVGNLTYAAGVGGDGVDLQGSAVLTNESGGTITGGPGGGEILVSPDSQILISTADAGAGVNVSASTTLDNKGTITGGSGSGTANDTGGAGVYQTAGTFTNYQTGKVSGGAGYGVGLHLVGGSATNKGTIEGAHTYGGTGVGVYEQGGTFTNAAGATVLGGAVGFNWQGGSLSNYGTITGGYGANGLQILAEQTAGDYQILTNGGTITGGGGAAGAYIEASGRLNVYSGTISGGGGGGGADGSTGSAGGTGAVLGAGATLLDGPQDFNPIATLADIKGGAGGYGSTTGGTGGIGVSLTSGSILYNPGVVTGGEGGASSASAGTGGAGGVGVYINGGDLVTDGTIAGGAGGAGATAGAVGVAVHLGDNGGLLAWQYGAVFNGQVAANPAGFAYLQLNGSGGDYFTGIGTQFTGFAQLGFSGAVTAAATVTSGAFAYDSLDVLNFTAGDNFDATNVAYSTVQSQISSGASPFSINGSNESFTENGVTITFENLGPNTLTYSEDPNGDTDITLACYRRGTRIATPRGDFPIETLGIGDEVITAEGMLPIRWIGRRSHRLRAGGDPDVSPIRISAGALGDDLPLRDLWVSPEHAMYLDGMLIAARDLVNGESIVRDDSVDEVSYFHVEFDRHTVIFAEGAPSESFVDDDSRNMFDNASEFRLLYSDVPSVPARFCAPRVEDGWELEAVRRHLGARGGAHA